MRFAYCALRTCDLRVGASVAMRRLERLQDAPQPADNNNNRWIVVHRKIVALLAALTLSPFGSALAAWPEDKPIEVVIGFAPGGGTDVMARKLLPFVEKRLDGRARFVVLNKPGAGGELAFTSIARAGPDAYPMGVVSVPRYNFLPLTRKTQYSPDEIRLVARVVEDRGVIVVARQSRFAKLTEIL